MENRTPISEVNVTYKAEIPWENILEPIGIEMITYQNNFRTCEEQLLRKCHVSQNANCDIH